MNDGQTAFWPNGLSNDSWRVQYTCSELWAKNSIRKFIVVAVHPLDRDAECVLIKYAIYIILQTLRLMLAMFFWIDSRTLSGCRIVPGVVFLIITDI
jgi:hypothetical protein